MALKKFRPTTASRRHMAISAFEEITRSEPEKSLLAPYRQKAGRNTHGRITVRHRGGGHKQRLRRIDFRRDKQGIPAKVAAIEYDPTRSARIALLHYADGEKRYILAPMGLKVGMKVESGPKAEPEVGNALPLAKIPLGVPVHNVELTPGRGAQIVRSAGLSAQIMSRDECYATLRLPSGEVRMVLVQCLATVGQVGNMDHQNISSGKAGRARWLGRRPTVRGVAMNPVDHPMGGGEGRSSGGGHPVSPWGWHTKGHITRKKRKASTRMIVQPRKKRK